VARRYFRPRFESMAIFGTFGPKSPIATGSGFEAGAALMWTTGRIVEAFRGQWNVEELFRRAKKGGVAPWGPSHRWADGSIRLHTFATVLGLMLVSRAKITFGTGDSASAMMSDPAAIRATPVRTTTRGPGRRATVTIAPELTNTQRRAVKAFELERWMRTLLSCMTTGPVNT
jgi:hypothetical protein